MQHRIVKVFPWDIAVGDTVVAIHFNDAPVVGTIADIDPPDHRAAGHYTDTYETGHTFRFTDNSKVWIRIDKPGGN